MIHVGEASWPSSSKKKPPASLMIDGSSYMFTILDATGLPM